MKHILKTQLYTIMIICIFALYLSFLTIDIYTIHNSTFSSILKYISILLCFILSLLFYQKSTNRKDSRLVCLALLCTLAADVFLLFGLNQIFGVFLFCIVQLIYLRRFSPRNFKIGAYISASIFLFLSICKIISFSLPTLYIIAGLYAYLIIACTISTFFTPLPKFNRTCVQVGMILFMLCDLNVALFNTLPSNSGYYHIAAFSMWLFYLPSQLLLSISSHHGELCQQLSSSSLAKS